MATVRNARSATGVAAALVLIGCSSSHLVTERGVVWTGAPSDHESNTSWTAQPTYLVLRDGTRRALGLGSMEGIEEPNVRWIVARQGVVPDYDTNITDRGHGALRMMLRYRAADPSGGWWDGDQRTDRHDRQRAEVKGLGPHQKEGETYEYGTTFRTDPDFRATDRFCHIMQIKATDGDKGMPLVTLSLRRDGIGVLQYASGKDAFRTARTFHWSPGRWTKVRFRLTVSQRGHGALLLSVDGGAFAGVRDVAIYRPDASDYRPKWGLYRAIAPTLHDDWVEHRNLSVKRLS